MGGRGGGSRGRGAEFMKMDQMNVETSGKGVVDAAKVSIPDVVIAEKKR